MAEQSTANGSAAPVATSQHLVPGGADDSRPESTISQDESKSTASQQPPTDTPATSAKVSTADEDEWKPPTDGPQQKPIPKLSPSSKPPPAAKLTPAQEADYATVLSAVSKWSTVPSTTAKNAPEAPLEDHERMFLTRECLLRYLRATKWKPADALQRLQATLSWRREYGADKFTHDYVSPENETGKQFILGWDLDGRTCLYLNPANQNTKMSDRQIHHLCYMLDRTIDMMPPGVETNALIVDFSGAAKGSVPSIAQARAALNILQNHNPERLGRALITHTPWYISTFFKLISPFIDPVTRDKMRFNEDLRNFVPPAQLWSEANGDLEFKYDHSIYWPALYEECSKRREAYKARWEKGGKRIGESEPYLRGGNQPSLSQIEAAKKTNGEAGASEQSDVDATINGVAKLSV